jgi:DNA processing protein
MKTAFAVRVCMRETIWFSNFCPYFSVYDLERFEALFGRHGPVTEELLRSMDLQSAARWLSARHDEWDRHLSQAGEVLTGRWPDIKLVFWGDDDYPVVLSHLSFPPAVLFYRGSLSVFEKPSVSIVGARHPTDLGRMWVQKVVPDLTREEYCIVSGGARGIDAEAHYAAVNTEGASIAFLPCGLERVYPAGNKSLFDRIQRSGALCSEYLPSAEVRAENFHKRNRLIAGSSLAVVIVEAGLKSGTIMTANHARDENRTVLVVPGPPFIASYAGSLELLRNGAGLARDAQDVIELVRKNF